MGIAADRPLWVCGSTGPGEEKIILSAYRQLLQELGGLAQGVHSGPEVSVGIGLPALAVVPRKPERFDEVARLIERAGFSCVRRSDNPDGSDPGVQPSAVMLGDTMGELRKFYSLATVVFVGRSLVPMGGSDPMEAAALGKPVLVGPHTANFRIPVEALARRDAIRIVASPDQLSGCGSCDAPRSLGSTGPGAAWPGSGDAKPGRDETYCRRGGRPARRCPIRFCTVIME